MGAMRSPPLPESFVKPDKHHQGVHRHVHGKHVEQLNNSSTTDVPEAWHGPGGTARGRGAARGHSAAPGRGAARGRGFSLLVAQHWRVLHRTGTHFTLIQRKIQMLQK